MKQLEKFYKGKRILVAGGAGFIGSHLVERLVGLGAKVSVLDNFSTGKIQNLKNIISRITLIYSDIRFEHVCLKATQNKDIIFHLAALVSSPLSMKYSDLCKKINLRGTENLLEGCVKNNVGKIVFSSSCAVYGNRQYPCKETDLPCPLTPYAQSKLDAENLCKEYSKRFNIQTVALRYFNVYGERQSPNGDYAGVIAKFKYNLENNLPLIIFGDGQQTRDFIHVSEVVDANLEIAMIESLFGDVFNIASGRSVNILELVKHLEKEVGKKAHEIKFEGTRFGDIDHSFADCTKYRKIMQSSFYKITR